MSAPHSHGTPEADARSRVCARLSQGMRHGTVIAQSEALKPYECDGLSAYRATPLAVAIPTSEEEVAAVLRVARESSTPLVTRGSGTGLSGGALPLTDGVLMSMARFNRIVRVDALQRQARVQPGVTNLRISQHVAPLGLYY